MIRIQMADNITFDVLNWILLANQKFIQGGPIAMLTPLDEDLVVFFISCSLSCFLEHRVWNYP